MGKMKGPRTLESPILTERLRIQRPALCDAETMFRYRSDPVINYYQTWVPASVDEVRTFIAGLMEIEIDTPGRWFQLGLFDRDTGAMAGDCGIHVQASDPRQAEIGITLARTFQGRGLATEALGAVIEYLFTKRGKHRVFGSVDPRNTASMALLARVGMRREAHFVESLWFKGAWADDVIFAMLEREFAR
jgi:RimJ/RimL family protein N-acetyltransferase